MNRHGLRRGILSPLCIPISPLAPGVCGLYGRDRVLCWRRGAESNRPGRICNPLHNRFATAPLKLKRENGRLQSSVFPRIWSGKGGSNSRPQPWQGCALPTELFPRCLHLATANYKPNRQNPATTPIYGPGQPPRPFSGNTPSKSGSAGLQPRSARCPSAEDQKRRWLRDTKASESRSSVLRS